MHGSDRVKCDMYIIHFTTCFYIGKYVMLYCLLEVSVLCMYSGAQNKRDNCCLNQKRVAEGKSAVKPLSSWLQITTD